MREGLGQSYTKKSVRMMIKEAIELGDPNVSHLVPTRYVNEKYGQSHGHMKTLTELEMNCKT